MLVQEASASVGAPLPTPDVTDCHSDCNVATGGKVALVNTTTPLGCNGGSTPCSAAQLAQIVDLVGYGNANFYEGSWRGPTLSNTTGALSSKWLHRTDNNATDYVVGAPAPRNTASPLSALLRIVAHLTVATMSLPMRATGTTSFNITSAVSCRAGGVTFDIATADNHDVAGDFTRNR